MSNLGKPRWSVHVLLVGAVSVLLAGCGGSSSAPAPAPSSPNLSAPTQVSSTSSQDEWAAVEAAYTAFWSRALHTDDKPEVAWRDELAAVAVDPQLTKTLEAMRNQKQAGVKVYGDVTARITSVQVDGASAKVVDCQDASGTGQADAKTGDRKTVGVARNPVIADLKQDSTDGRWKVAEVSFPGGTC